MKKNNVVVLHHADMDGYGAAYAAWLKLGDEATYIPVNYGEPVPELPKGTVSIYIVDFSYSREICEELAEKYNLVILDHHKTAEKALAGLKYATFDMTKSGAMLAWEFFHGGETAPPIINYIQDYDLWKFELIGSVEVNLFLTTLPKDFEFWRDIVPKGESTFFNFCFVPGAAIKAFQDGQIEYAVNQARIIMLGDYEVPCVNATVNISKVGNVLCEHYPEAPFSISYCDRKDIRTWSLRSIGEFDVGEFAKLWGGGGHKNAAGFTTPLDWPEYTSPETEMAFAEAAGRADIGS